MLWLSIGGASIADDSSTSEDVSAKRPPPPYVFLRQNEDWSLLAEVARAELTDPLDRIKYVPLSRDRPLCWVSFGGSARLRVETWSGFAFGTPAVDDDTFALSRVLAHGDFHFGSRARLFVQGKSALATSRDLPGGTRTIDVDSLDLQQGFVDVTASQGDGRGVVIRVGRQGLQYGKQRLVSPLPWGNTLRAWDGASVLVKRKSWTIDAYWTRPVLVDKHDPNGADNGSEFFGTYAARSGRWSSDLYLLGLDRDQSSYNGTVGSEKRYTAGFRAETPTGVKGPRLEVEAAYQFGDVGSAQVSAWMLAVQGVWAMGAKSAAPSLTIALDLASGDRSPGGDVETFNQLFPLGHAYLGITDFVGRQNIAALKAGITLRPRAKLSLVIASHVFRRYSTADALYHAGGQVLFPGDAGASRDVGVELDAVVVYRLSRHLLADVGYAHFFAGEFVKQAGGNHDTDFGYVQGRFVF